MELPATCHLTYLVPPPPCKQALKLGRNCDKSHKHELLNFYCICDDSPGTQLGKSRRLFLLFSRIPCPHRWHNGINYPESYLFRACLHGGEGPQVGEVTRLGGVTRLSIQSLILMWSHLHVRWGNPPHATSPTWGPQPSCKQALNRLDSFAT